MALQGSLSESSAFSPEIIFELFGDTNYIESQNFNRLHRIVLEFYQSSLEDALQDDNTDINATDAKDRTPLY
jgi:hypothetical protein